jgi:hypothetical protein
MSLRHHVFPIIKIIFFSRSTDDIFFDSNTLSVTSLSLDKGLSLGKMVFNKYQSRNGSVGALSRLRNGRQRIRVSIPG